MANGTKKNNGSKKSTTTTTIKGAAQKIKDTANIMKGKKQQYKEMESW